MIELRDVTFSYGRGGRPVFEGFEWTVGAGESWAVVGPSGGGKTTLLYLIAGLREPAQGVVTIGGERASRVLRQGAVGLVLQDYGLLPWASVLDNASLGLRVRRMYGLSAPPATATPAEWLARLGIDHLRDKYPGQLSGGERQRVAIARALALGPRVLLLDEPFSALDTMQREDLERLTLQVGQEAGATTVFVTHSIEEAVFVGRRILVLGRPPNRVAVVVENPSDGSDPSGRCAQVRAVLAGEASS